MHVSECALDISFSQDGIETPPDPIGLDVPVSVRWSLHSAQRKHGSPSTNPTGSLQLKQSGCSTALHMPVVSVGFVVNCAVWEPVGMAVAHDHTVVVDDILIFGTGAGMSAVRPRDQGLGTFSNLGDEDIESAGCFGTTLDRKPASTKRFDEILVLPTDMSGAGGVKSEDVVLRHS